MKLQTQPQTQHSLNWLCDSARALVDSVGLRHNGRALITLFGKGDETDNVEALLHWLDTLDERIEANDKKLYSLFQKKLHASLRQMRKTYRQPYRAIEGLPFVEASTRECENLAYALVFLTRWHLTELDRRNGTHYSQQWETRKALDHCIEKIQSFDLYYQVNASYMLNLLANHYFHRSVLPWMDRVPA
jgi:hypothetical protein